MFAGYRNTAATARKIVLATLVGLVAWQLVVTDTELWKQAIVSALVVGERPAVLVTILVWVALFGAAVRTGVLTRRAYVEFRNLGRVEELALRPPPRGRSTADVIRPTFAREGVEVGTPGAASFYVEQRLLSLEHGCARIRELAVGLGLLGTVLGLMMEMGAAAVGLTDVKVGIGTAVQTTAAGLFVGLPAGFVRGLISERLEMATSRIGLALAQQGPPALTTLASTPTELTETDALGVLASVLPNTEGRDTHAYP